MMVEKAPTLGVYALILLAIVINVAAQMLLKLGMQRIGYFAFSAENMWPVGLRIASNPYILGGFAFYVFSVLVWLMVLSRVDVSLAYPLSSFGYVLVALAAYFLFGEQISALRMVGIFVVIFGVYLISKS